MLWKINTCIHIIHSIVSRYLLYYSYLSVDLRFVHMYCASIICITLRRGQVQTCFWRFMDVGFWWKNIKNVYLEKIIFKDLQKKTITWFEISMAFRISIDRFSLIFCVQVWLCTWQFKKKPRFWCKFIYWVKLICRYQSHVLLNQSNKCNM